MRLLVVTMVLLSPGSGSFDEVAEVISGGKASTLALEGSTEKAQF